MISLTVDRLFYFYSLLIIIRIFLTWIPTIDWTAQPFAAIRAIVDPFLNIFKNIIPPIGGVLDISPIFAIILLQLAQGFVYKILSGLGL